MLCHPLETKTVRVLLQQNSISHYRAGLYRALCGRDDATFDFIADPESDTPFMKVHAGLEELGSRFHQVRTLQWKLPGVPVLYFQPEALGLLRELKPDITLALGSPYSLTTWLLLLYGRAVGFPVVLWTHGLLKDESGPKWWLRSLLYRTSAGLVLYGDRARQLLEQKGLPRKKLHVIYNSLDDHSQKASYEASLSLTVSEARQKIGVASADRVAVFIGRLQAEKKLDRIIQTVADAKEADRSLHAVLVGKGSQEDDLRALARQLGVADRVHFYGACHDENELGTIFRASDICLIPSAAGLTVMHAFAYATPVIANDNLAQSGPEIEAIDHGRTGFLFAFNDPNGLTAATMEALYPTSVKETMGQACLDEIALRYNPNEQARRMVNALMALLALHQKPEAQREGGQRRGSH